MYQWRKFEFFEEKSGGKSSIPAEITGRIDCCSGGRGRVVIGCDDGTVSLLDRGFKHIYGFQAHASSVLFLQQLKVGVLSLTFNCLTDVTTLCKVGDIPVHPWKIEVGAWKSNNLASFGVGR